MMLELALWKSKIIEQFSGRNILLTTEMKMQCLTESITMVNVIVPFHVTHNAEAEAVDLLIEVQRLKILLEVDAVNEHNYSRICMYLAKTADYMSDPDDYTVCMFLVL